MRTVGDLSSTDVREILRRTTAQDFAFSNERPEDCIFALRDYNVKSVDSICIEYAVKNTNGILIMTEPVTRLDFYRIPEDARLSDMARDEAIKDIMSQYQEFLQDVYQDVYMFNSKFRTNIKMEENVAEPRLFLFVSNSRDADVFITSVAVLEQLLPRLEQSA